MTASELAKNAFYGNNEQLYARLCWDARYTLNGIEYPANGLDLAECIELVNRMNPAELATYA